MLRKNITIRSDQAKFVEKRNINLSGFVQDALDERMDEVGAEIGGNTDE